jgi:4-hydroxyphenylacetate 3-monooxygenase
MLLTGQAYVESIRDGRMVWIDGERVSDVTRHPAFRSMVEARARVYESADRLSSRPEGGP